MRIVPAHKAVDLSDYVLRAALRIGISAVSLVFILIWVFQQDLDPQTPR